MKIDGRWLVRKLDELCEEIKCPRIEAMDCEDCPILALKQEALWLPEFETEYEELWKEER